jgi:HAD superfamily hydrolase (TIGR01459 family)
MTMGRTSADELIARYDVFFLDAYGVLVRSSGALPEAADFLRRIEAAGKRFLILSNDASRSPATTERRYRGFGLPIAIDQVVTSGMLIRPHYAALGLQGARTIVLGTEDSDGYVTEAGGKVVPPDDELAEVVVVADDDGYDLLETANKVVTVLLHRLDRGQRTHLVLPNPDLLFPGPGGSCGLTAGAIAAMIESVLRLRDPAGQLRFVPLGKPHRPIFEAAMQRLPGVDPRRIVMVGDQIVTDIRGANDFGLDSAFVETGVGRHRDAAIHGVSPTWILKSLA